MNRVTPSVRLKVYRRSDFTCVGCGWRPVVPEGYDGRYALGDPQFRDEWGQRKLRLLEIDHIYPRALGGRGGVDHSNLQAMCNSCNARKGAKV